MTHEQLADKCLVALVRHVLAHQGKILAGITYQELARRIDFLNKNGDPHPRLGSVLGKMGHKLETVGTEFPEGIPDIQALVVVKTGPNEGIPDDGIKEFWDGYDRLNRLEKENKAFAEWDKIAAFSSRWTRVLQLLKLLPQELPADSTLTSASRRGGGESPAHLALKAYVKANPGLVGMPSDAEAFEEYALPSLDVVDVLFKTSGCWTAVEVKSSVSDAVAGDYKRGLYQTIKYEALFNAMRSESSYEVPGQIRVVLVLEGSLPADHAPLRDALGAAVIENINPPATRPSP